MSRFQFLILLAIAIITTTRPTLAADIDAGAFAPAAGYNDDLKQPVASYCAGTVKIVDDTSITLEGFNFSKAPWGQVVAFSKDAYEGKWPNDPNEKPMKQMRPIDAVFVKEGIPDDDNKCFSFSEGDDYTGTLKVRAADGKKIVKETTIIGIYCLRFNVLFCRVNVTGKLDGITAGDGTTAPKCGSKFTECWYKGGDDLCKERPPKGSGGGGDGGNVTNSRAALPMSSKWTPLLTSGLFVLMLAFPCLINGSLRNKAE